jgi:hypothetical protein
MMALPRIKRSEDMIKLRLLHPVLVVAPLVMWRARSITNGWPANGPAWVPAVVAVWTLYAVLGAFVIERQYSREPTISRLRAKGHSPEHSVALIGMVLMLAPVSVALFAGFFGLSASLLARYAAVSVAGVAFWGWRHRRVIYA